MLYKIRKLLNKIILSFFSIIFGLFIGWLFGPLLPDESPFAPEHPDKYQLSTSQNVCDYGQVAEIVKFAKAETSIELLRGAKNAVICADLEFYATKHDLAKRLAIEFPGCFSFERGKKYRLYLRLDNINVCRSSFILRNGSAIAAPDGLGVYICLGDKARFVRPYKLNQKVSDSRKCLSKEIRMYGFK